MSTIAESISIPAQTEAADRRRRIVAIVGASSGNLVEWYDFYAYAFTSIYFASAFFPAGDTTSQLLPTAGIFAVGFFMRPLGTAATYMSEVASKGSRGFYSSFQYVTLIGGQLLALLVLAILQSFLTTDELKAWGWRIPFVIGALAAIVAMYLRRSLAETATAEAMHNKEAGSVVGLVRNHPRAVLLVLAFTMGGSLYFYTFTTYMQKYLVNTAHMDAKAVTFVMTAVLIVFMLLQPVFGALSDRIGRKNNMILFTALGAIAAAPLLFALGSVTSPYLAFILVLLALAIASFYTSISGVVKAELFPAEVRALGVGLTYAVANAGFANMDTLRVPDKLSVESAIRAQSVSRQRG